MSNNDSFIDEVTEEVRRDRLFILIRRWGWVAALAVILLVGGAAWNEYRKASLRAEAEALGDAVLAALEADTPEARIAALDAVPETGPHAPLLALLEASAAIDPGTVVGTESEEALAARDALRVQAADRLDALAQSSDVAPTYRQLAELKLLMLRGADLPAEDRLKRLDALSKPGAPFRVLAQEQKALVLIESGTPEAREEALSLLRQLLEDQQATAGLRRRVSQLIVALGGRIDAA